ncbi:unnamed protein product, partial [Polarella glacialis]
MARPVTPSQAYQETQGQLQVPGSVPPKPASPRGSKGSSGSGSGSLDAACAEIAREVSQLMQKHRHELNGQMQRHQDEVQIVLGARLREYSSSEKPANIEQRSTKSKFDPRDAGIEEAEAAHIRKF